MTTKPLIQRVTHILLRDNKDFERYLKPIAVALGPLHHDYSPDSKLQRGEESKLRMAAKFIEYSGTKEEDFYREVKADINSLRECYDSKQIETWSDEYLAWMFLVDGCAILFFIDQDATPNLEELGCKDDLLAYVKMDLFLLENQLPYRLLQILMDLCSRVPRPDPPDEECKNKSAAEVLKASITIFIDKNAMSLVKRKQQKHPMKNSEQQQQQQQTAAEATTAITIDTQREPAHLLEREPAHLLELLWRRLTKSEKDKESDGAISKLLKELCPSGEKGSDVTISKGNSGDKNSHWRPTFRSVKQLNENGIWLEVSNSSSIEDISFQKCFFWATLKLPPITVDDFTWPMLMNLIAYEMCPDFKNHFEISSYVSFLDSLINQREDVKLMKDAGVLYNGLGSEKAVALLFNKISKNLASHFWSQPQHSHLKDQIQAHCNSKFATSMAQLYHTYFRSPWSVLAFFGALLGLGLTAMQTYEAYY